MKVHVKMVASSPSFRKGPFTSKVAGGISMGLNSPRPEGILSVMLSRITLRTQASVKQYSESIFIGILYFMQKHEHTRTITSTSLLRET